MLKMRKLIATPQHMKPFYKLDYVDYEPLIVDKHYGYSYVSLLTLFLKPGEHYDYHYYATIVPGFEDVFAILIVTPPVRAGLTTSLIVDGEKLAETTTTVYPGQGDAVVFKRLFNLSPGIHDIVLRLESDTDIDAMHTAYLIASGKLIRKYTFDTPVSGSTSFGFAYDLTLSLLGTEYVLRDGVVYIDVSTVDKEAYLNIHEGFPYIAKFIAEELPFEVEFKNDVILINEYVESLLKIEVPFKGATTFMVPVGEEVMREGWGVMTVCVSESDKHYVDYSSFPFNKSEVIVFSFQTIIGGIEYLQKNQREVRYMGCKQIPILYPEYL